MNERSIFEAALEMNAPAERSAFLDQACTGDTALRQRIEALLRSHDSAGSFLGMPVPDRLAEQFSSGGAETDEERQPLPPDSEALGFLAPPTKPNSLGRLGHYEVMEVVGHGGMGIVLKAFDEKLHRIVAIKVIGPELAASGDARQRFIREAQAAAAVAHEHVVTIHAVEEDHRPPYLVMQFVDGVSLQEKLDKTGALSVREILRIGMQTAAGLAAAHAQGLIHRDIKPANILLENGVERVRITDFGLARAASDASVTQTGLIVGTPQYMAPEQATGQHVDHRSDLFSLGSVLYAMCTGQAPFRGSTTLAVMKRVCEESPRPVQELNPDVPSWLIQAIDRLLAKRPAERFQSAAEVAALLGQNLALLQQPSAVGQLSNLSTSARAGSAPRSLLWVAAAAGVLLLTLALLLTESAGITHLATLVIRTPGQQEDGVAKTVNAKDKPTSDGGSAANVNAGASAAVTSPVANSINPFVILTHDGQPAKAYGTLADAVLKSMAGDTIEIRGNGPFEVEPFRLPSSRVIRAGQGFQPVITVVVSDQIAAGAPRSLESRAPLVLEGLEFQLAVRGAQRSVVAVNATGPGSIHVANCRFSGCQVMTQHLSVCQVRNCLVFGGPIALLDNGPSGHAVIENNVAVRADAAPFIIRPGRTEQRLELARNVLIGRSSIGLNVSVRIADDPHPLQIQATQNILVGRPCAVHFNVSEVALAAEWTQGPKAEELLRKAIAWNEERNLYSADASFLSLGYGPWITAIQPTRSYRTLADWNEFWNAQDTTSSAGAIQFAGGDIFERSRTAAAQLTPADFRLRPDSAGYRAGPDGKDLGPDIDLVGPGTAYERWKQTPEYQVWLKKTGQLQERAEVKPEPQSFVVLDRKGVEQSKFATLADAVLNSADGDTIEIRASGPFVCKPVVVDRPLVIRANPGCEPVLKLRPEDALAKRGLFEPNAPLVLEGLELQVAGHEELPTPWPALFRPRASGVPLYVANCRMVVEPGASVLGGHPSSTIRQMRNCLCLVPSPAVRHVLNPVTVASDPVRSLVIDNNVIVSRLMSLAFRFSTRPADVVSVQLTRNTLIGSIPIVFYLDAVPTSVGEKAPAPFLFESSGNILHGVGIAGAFRFEQSGDLAAEAKALPTADAERLLPHLVEWRERLNLHTSSIPLLNFAVAAKSAESGSNVRTLADWNTFWGLEDTASLQGIIRYEGGDLLQRAWVEPELLKPQDFRLRAKSVGYRAGKDGKDLGADVDLVGPGDAYERWKQTPEYKDWLEETGQTK